MHLEEPYTHLPCLRRPASKHFLGLLLVLALLEGGNSISPIDRPRLIRRGVSTQSNSNTNSSLEIEVSAFGIANQSRHEPDEKQVAASVLQDPPAAVVVSGVPNRITPADSSLKIKIGASGISNRSRRKPDEKQVAATVHQDPPAAKVVSGVHNRITPAALVAAAAAQPATAAGAPAAAAGGAMPAARPPGSPASPDVALNSPNTEEREAVAPATTDATTDGSAPAGAWLSGPIVSFLILGCLLYRCCWSEDTDTTDVSATARRASLDAAAAAFTQRRPSAFAASMHKAPPNDQDASRPSRKYRRASRDAGENGSPAHSGSQPPDSPNMKRGSADAPNMKRATSYRDRRRMSTGNQRGDSEASHTEEQTSMARASSYRTRREASRGREPRRASSVARETSASRGQAQSREPSASRARAEPDNEEF